MSIRTGIALAAAATAVAAAGGAAYAATGPEPVVQIVTETEKECPDPAEPATEREAL